MPDSCIFYSEPDENIKAYKRGLRDYIMNNIANWLLNMIRTSTARYLEPKGEVSIMKPVRVLWSRKYLMKPVGDSKVLPPSPFPPFSVQLEAALGELVACAPRKRPVT